MKKRVRKQVKEIAGQTFWTASKAAKYAGISRATLHNYSSEIKDFKGLVKQKIMIASLKIGGQRFYMQKWLDEFLQSRISGEGTINEE
jgi:ACT domain-containing protein